ncbi:helix-turn-helix domain-containing protein [Ruegeria arenilitoris]|uniref:helix-turn-helix domain-containing protein n=1 Tax=Ruegeria arenilitoris TaxID=1173585 RepID=UPI00147C5AE0|nr:helix-turn-helix domain-containing protein [Ruegeria arenilitoris]
MYLFSNPDLAMELARAAAILKDASDFTNWRKLNEEKIDRVSELVVQLNTLAEEAAGLLGVFDQVMADRAGGLIMCRWLMHQNGISAADLAREIGVSRATVFQVLNGYSKSPGSPAEHKILAYLLSLPTD